MEFSYFMPAPSAVWRNVIDQLGATAKSYGTHALIVTGRSSTKRSGLLDRSSPAEGRGRPAPRYSIRWSPTP